MLFKISKYYFSTTFGIKKKILKKKKFLFIRKFKFLNILVNIIKYKQILAEIS
jgi:hypothetical protein